MSRNTRSVSPPETMPANATPDNPLIAFSEETLPRDFEDSGLLLHRPADTQEHLQSDSLHDEEIQRRAALPWWKRPSYFWVFSFLPLAAAVMSATIAPRVQIYTAMTCAVHRPDLFKEAYPSSTFHDWNSHSSDPKICESDPIVQAETAKLSAVVTTVTGILSFLTTAWWGSFSDRHGRVRVLGIGILGLLITDANFILVSFKFRSLPTGYWFLLVSAIAEGLLGGLATSIAAFHSFLADSTNPINRGRIFSFSSGLLFGGMAVGPILGGELVDRTGSSLSIFYVALGMHILFSIVMWTILPEPLSKARMAEARRKHRDASRLRAEQRNTRDQSRIRVFLSHFSRVFQFVGILLDVFSPIVSDPSIHPLKRKRDWNLPVLAAGYGFIVMLMGVYPYKIQFAGSHFHWSQQMLGYWLSLVSIGRVVSLLVLLPLATFLFKPKPITLLIPVESPEQERLLPSSPSTPHPHPPRTQPKEIYSPTFELNVARAAIFIDVVAYIFMSLIIHPTIFTLFGFVGAFSAAFNPSIQTVALDLHVSRTQSHVETGKLFGALSVIQALCSQVVGPALFGLVYARSVLAGFPRAIFVLAAGLVSVTFILLFFIRLPKHYDLVPGEDEESSVLEAPESQSPPSS